MKTDIFGCYVTSTAPPPDLWLISRDARRSVAYAASAGLGLGQINTVIKSQDPQWQNLQYYIDSHCSGTVDLIGYQRQGSGVIDSYRLPEKPLRLVTLAQELDRALKRRDIPYPTLRVCQ